MIIKRMKSIVLLVIILLGFFNQSALAQGKVETYKITKKELMIGELLLL